MSSSADNNASAAAAAPATRRDAFWAAWHSRLISGIKEDLARLDPAVAQQLDLLLRLGDLDYQHFQLIREPQPEEKEQ